jgi:hypothetical protein
MQKHNSITKHNQLFVAKKNERNDNEHGQMPSGSKAWSLRLRLEDLGARKSMKACFHSFLAVVVFDLLLQMSRVM